MQAGKRVGVSKERDRSGEEEEHARADREHTEDVENGAHRWSPWSDARRAGDALTNATDAKLESSASPSATFSTPATSVAEAARSSAAMPPVPRSCTATILSTSRGP